MLSPMFSPYHQVCWGSVENAQWDQRLMGERRPLGREAIAGSSFECIAYLRNEMHY